MFEKLRERLKDRFEYWEQEIKDDDVMDFSGYDLREAINNETEFKLYRYMPPTYFNIRNIETQKIHLSTNGVMNDIYEGLPVFDNNNYQVEELSDLAYMSCFTESNGNSLMWSHYAEQNTGICVEYDLKKLINSKADGLKHIFPIIYMEKRIIERDIDSLISSNGALTDAIKREYEYDGDEILDDILPLFLTKGKVWEYEREWRVIYSKKQMYDLESPELYSRNIKFECVSGVYLGYRIHPEIKKNIIEICARISTDDYKIKVHQAELDNEGYEIRFREL